MYDEVKSKSTDSETEQKHYLRQLRTRISKGDSVAEQQLCEYLNGRFNRLFLSKGYHLSAIEDANQEALIALLNALREGRIEDDSSIEGYLYTAMKYQLWRSIKKTQRYTSLFDNLHHLESDIVVDCAERVEKQQHLERVVHSIGRLKTRRDQEILLRTFFREDGIVSICEHLSLQRSHYYRVLHRARNRLTQLLQ